MYKPDRFASDRSDPSDRVEAESTRAEDNKPGAALGGVSRDGRGRVCSDDGGVSDVDSGPVSADLANLGDLLLERPNAIGAHRH
jgi:hypothetical protein